MCVYINGFFCVQNRISERWMHAYNNIVAQMDGRRTLFILAANEKKTVRIDVKSLVPKQEKKFRDARSWCSKTDMRLVHTRSEHKQSVAKKAYEKSCWAVDRFLDA